MLKYILMWGKSPYTFKNVLPLYCQNQLTELKELIQVNHQII